jgi:aryl-alcohol dehydrogenase
MRATSAVLSSASGPFELLDVELDDPRDDEVLVRIAGTGICHSDLVHRSGLLPLMGPTVLGHEGSGVVEQVGAQVTGVKPGDRVVASYASCGRCKHCLRGAPQYCAQFYPLNLAGCRPDGSITTHDLNGNPIAASFFGQSSFSSHALVNERNLVVVNNDSLPLELLGPFGCGFQTGAGAVVNTLGVRAGSSLLVMGCGGVGMAAVMAGAVAGCRAIIGVDVHANRLELALKLGATHAINAAEVPSVLEAVLTALGGPVDFSLDTSGVGARTAVDAIGPGGRAALVAAGMGELTLEGTSILFGKTVCGLFEGDSVPQNFLPELFALATKGDFPFMELTRTYPLSEINTAVADQESGRTIKAILVP